MLCYFFHMSLSPSLVPWGPVSISNMDLVLGLSGDAETKGHKGRFIIKNGSPNYVGWEVSQSAFVSWRLRKASGVIQLKSKYLRNGGAGDARLSRKAREDKMRLPTVGRVIGFTESTDWNANSHRETPSQIYPDIMLDQICGPLMNLASFIFLVITETWTE